MGGVMILLNQRDIKKSIQFLRNVLKITEGKFQERWLVKV